MKGNRFLIAALLGSVVLSGMSFQVQASESLYNWARSGVSSAYKGASSRFSSAYQSARAMAPDWVTTIVNKLSEHKKEALLLGLAAVLGYTVYKNQEKSQNIIVQEFENKLRNACKEFYFPIIKVDTTVGVNAFILLSIGDSQLAVSGPYKAFTAYGQKDVEAIFDACQKLKDSVISASGTQPELKFPEITKKEIADYRTVILGDAEVKGNKTTYLMKEYDPAVFVVGEPLEKGGYESSSIDRYESKARNTGRSVIGSYFSRNEFVPELAIKAKDSDQYKIRK